LLQTDQIIHGTTLSVLNTLPSESIDCVITSPPYWGLRDYGIEGQLGLEPTFQLYIEHLQTIFDEVYRVLKKTGTCWVDIGDTYSGSWGDAGNRPERSGIPSHQRKRSTPIINRNGHPQDRPPSSRVQTVQPKSLCNIPFRFAISMTDHKWIQRNTIIWHKPSCMPSSAKDRFTVDFEYVFFFTKNKKYYFVQQFEAYTEATINRAKYGQKNSYKIDAVRHANVIRPDRSALINKSMARIANGENKGRNKRTVWRINPQSFKDAHFAVFPEKLVEPMIKAGCPSAGAVLDPFVGSGTTALVARKLGRHYIGIDLNEDYVTMANKRLSEVL